MYKALRGAVRAPAAVVGGGALYGAFARYKECGAVADPLTSAMIHPMIALIFFGIPAVLIGAILGVVIKPKPAAEDEVPCLRAPSPPPTPPDDRPLGFGRADFLRDRSSNVLCGDRDDGPG